MTGEGAELMKVSGTGEVFLADLAQEEMQLLKLSGEKITVNGAICWRSTPTSTGTSSGWMASRGPWAAGCTTPPLRQGLGRHSLRRAAGAARGRRHQTFADPQAAITWSEGVRTSVKTDVNLKTFIGRGSGESVQLAFSGKGWLLIQPSEGRVTSAAAGDPAGASSATGAIGS